MKKELAYQLLHSILPSWEEDRLQKLFRDLDALAEYKYNYYEMFQPGRLFFENLYLWLSRFTEEDRTVALRFVERKLIFISRVEFQQLTQLLYHDRIHRRHLDLASSLTGIPRFLLQKLSQHDILRRIERASLYVALSDGARIDYFRRQNLNINNEQVLTTYLVSEEKVSDLVKKLERHIGHGARFQCLFLIDDFFGSGRTLLRENDGTAALEGALARLSESPLLTALESNAGIYLCPLLTTNLAMTHLKTLTPRLKPPLNSLEILPVAVLPDSDRIVPSSDGSESADNMAALCERYYKAELADEHTGNVMYGYEECGLPVVLHHNTPNNSIYPLWSRKWGDPLFARYERHGRELK